MDQGIIDKKRETVGDLYSIRAGLSYISVCADRVKANDEKIGAIVPRIKKRQQSIEDSKKRVREQSGKADRLEHDLSETKNKLSETESVVNIAQRKLKNISHKRISYKIDWGCFGLWLFSLVVLIGQGVVFGLFIKNFDVKTAAEEWLFIIVAAILTLAAVCWHIYQVYRLGEDILSNRRRAKDNKKQEIDSEKRFIDSCNKEIKTYEHKIKELYDEIPKVQRETPGIIEKLNEKIETEQGEIGKCNEEIAIIEKDSSALSAKSRDVYQALVDAYGAFFHPDNWKHIDRVLYYLNTGRADTIRDSLNLMDQRLNAELIANEIRQSSEMISGEIRRSTREVTAAVSLGAERIRDAMERAASAIVESNKEIAASNDRLAKQTAHANSIAAANLAANQRLVSAQELNNSLQSKANSSMEQLLRDYQVVNNRVHY
ncbi:MAG: hypothetical protein IJT69_04795 [Clostridia bacterium]|nr:hypothetical protein [Clostridia bacterium]